MAMVDCVIRLVSYSDQNRRIYPDQSTAGQKTTQTYTFKVCMGDGLQKDKVHRNCKKDINSLQSNVCLLFFLACILSGFRKIRACLAKQVRAFTFTSIHAHRNLPSPRLSHHRKQCSEFMNCFLFHSSGFCDVCETVQKVQDLELKRVLGD